MDYIRSKKYETPEFTSKIMGPNPIKLCEELLSGIRPEKDAVVCDLGSGEGVTSVFMAKEYGLRVYACDLWSEPEDHLEFFRSSGLDDDRLTPVKADATDLPFEKEFFDAVVCTDSYNYFGRDKEYLDKCLLPFVKKGGYIFIAIPGMKKDMHDDLPQELLLSWTPEQLDYIHDIAYWKDIISASSAEIISIKEMESMDEVWADWIIQDNDYAKGDKKAIDAGGGKYLNFISIILKKQ